MLTIPNQLTGSFVFDNQSPALWIDTNSAGQAAFLDISGRDPSYIALHIVEFPPWISPFVNLP